MTHSCKPWTLPSNYSGLTWEGWHTAGFGRSRDSDVLEESNFQVAWETLKALQNPEGCTDEDETGVTDIRIVRESHWAVGWIEWIAIHSSNTAALAKAQELCDRANDYPVLDEEHFSNLEYTRANEVWASFGTSERIEYIRRHRSQFEFRDLADMLGCIRGKYFAGYASELLG